MLRQAESLLETNPAAADSILASMPEPASNRDRAWYAVLKTQADYKQRLTITDDSLIITATDYYGTSIRGSERRRYMSAMAWYSQGCTYSELGNDYAAIDAFLKAKDLFPDTLIRYYALAEQKLGTHYLNRMMLESARQQFESCKTNAERLNDTKMANYAFFYIGLCALYNRDFATADSVFGIIQNNNDYSFSQRSVAIMELAKINLYYYDDSNEALRLINLFLVNRKDLDNGAGLGVKADIFYEINEFDSAFHYYNESMKYNEDLYSRCMNADKLSELSYLIGNSDESIYWHKLYGELRDSINEIEKTREIEELKYKHNEAFIQEKLVYQHRRFIIIGVFVLLIIAELFFLIFSIFKNREKKKIVEKQQYLLQLEEKIRKSSIQVLHTRVGELSTSDKEVRTSLLELYHNRLNNCRNRFSKTDAYQKIVLFKLNAASVKMSKIDKEYLFDQLQLSYVESITDIVYEIPDIKEKEILTIILRHLDLSINQISDLFSITPIAVKQRISRLSKRAPSDFLSLFMKTHVL